MRVPRGHGVRKPFRLRPWQRELVALTWDARPAPRLAGWMLPCGQGKTSLVAVLALFELFAGEDGAQVVVLATDERQAGLCFRAATRMVELNPELERRVQLFQDRMAIPKRGASFQVLPAVPKRLEGLDYTLAILDEAGRIDRDVLEVVTWPRASSAPAWPWPSAPPAPSSTRPCSGGCASTWPSIPRTR